MNGILDNLLDLLKQAIYIVPVILLSLSIHETAHGYVAYKLGDNTAKSMGRLTLNPLAHMDPMGTVMLLISSFSGFGFGWAKPVPINMSYFRNPKKGMVLSALAGPVSNFLTALIAGILMVFCLGIFGFENVLMTMNTGEISFASVFVKFMLEFIMINIGLGVFNLIPFPPLDGSKIVGGFLPNHIYYKILEYERYIGMVFVLIILFRSQWLSMIMNPVFDVVLSGLNVVLTPLVHLFEGSLDSFEIVLYAIMSFVY